MLLRFKVRNTVASLLQTVFKYFFYHIMAAEIYICFIVSPSDTQAEREACERVLSDINKNLGQFLTFGLKPGNGKRMRGPALEKMGKT